jgi:hypothetical protein
MSALDSVPSAHDRKAATSGTIALARRHAKTTLALGAVVWLAAIKALAPVWDWVLGGVLGLDMHARLGESLRFFVDDCSKIALLLAGIIFAVAVLRSFMSVERTRSLLGGRREGVGNCWRRRWGWRPRSARAQRFRRSSDSSQPACRSA